MSQGVILTMQQADRKLLVFILSYNEERNLPRLVEELRAEPPPAGFAREILVVDDGSTDGTLETARALGVKAVRHPINLGIGAAEQTGLLYARRHGFDVAVRIDGDGQHPPAGIDGLVRMVSEGEADLCIGSRFVCRDAGGSRSTRARRVGIRFFSSLCLLLTGRRIADPTSGFRCFGPRCIDLMSALPPSDFPEVESFLDITRKGLRVVEAPVPFRCRQEGRSTIRVHHAVYYMVKVTVAVLVGSLRGGGERAQTGGVLAGGTHR